MDGAFTPYAEIFAEKEKRIGGFLYELANGLSSYRSLHSLTEQIEHQYHGRVIIEMLQNAHDALSLAEHEHQGRIEIRLVPDDGEFGALYVANDGAVFSRSNFNSLSQLGQSDKDPAQSIGNKGIGFRSVLEITTAPEIFSRVSAESKRFDGYCFAFSPSVVEHLAQRVFAIMGGDETAHLDDWDAGMRAKLCHRLVELGVHGVERECRYLSPYLLPCPVEAGQAAENVRDFEERGFATVIRLPLKSSETADFVRGKLRELDNLPLLFLDQARVLIIDEGSRRRELTREITERPASQCGGLRLTISEGDNDREIYWLWSCEIAIHDAPMDVQEFLSGLPGKWPQLENVTFSLAVQLLDDPKPGRLSIFLPTLKGSGCGAYLNAPFFGDMSRTSIDFNNRYNQFLLEQCAALALRVIQNELAGSGEDEARAIVDLIAPFSSDGEAAERWQEALSIAASATGAIIKKERWFLTDQGWRELADAALIPEMSGTVVLTRAVLRVHASFPALISGLDSRSSSIRILMERHDIKTKPEQADLANTVERVAQGLVGQPEADWSGFWTDAEKLFGDDSLPLKGKRILLGNDGHLHATDESCTVFFGTRQGLGDGENVGVKADIVPDSLKAHVAFLSDKVFPLGKRDAQLKLRKFLEGELVHRFRVDDILRLVLVKRTPSAPVALTDQRGTLCSDLLSWGLRLISSLPVQEKGGSLMQSLSLLRVPCNGGWFRLKETTFGPGWPGSKGDALDQYLRLLPRANGKSAHARLLLSPDDPRWGSEGGTHEEILRKAGVSDGLRLDAIEPKGWSSSFQGGGGSFWIPVGPPSGIGKKLWTKYRELIQDSVRSYYQKVARYEVQTLHTFAGFEIIDELDDCTRLALMQALLDSMGGWGTAWRTASFERKEGNSDRPQAASPLLFALRTIPWLGITNAETTEWFRPDERWHIPVLAAHAWQFSHLRPLPVNLANRIDSSPMLAEALRALGMPRYDPEAPTESPRLLNDLAAAVKRNDIPHRDFFLGQVRSAWDCFHPGHSTEPPNLFVVSRGGTTQLATEETSSEVSIYLPDSTKSFTALEQFDLPLLAIEEKTARRLTDWFAKAYGDKVCATSTLQVIPLVQGARWDGDSAEPLTESEFAPLVPLILTVAAFAGLQPMGLGTRPFNRQVSTFRGARIVWTTDLRAALFRGAVKAAEPSVDAMWLKKEQVLLASEKCRADPTLLAEALTHLIERDDLELPLKLVLQSMSSLDPDADSLERALRLVKVTPERLHLVREHWHGDLSQTIRMLLPFLALLHPAAELGKLAELKNDAELEQFIDGLLDSRLSGPEVLRWCRKSADAFQFGKSVWLKFGDPVQLREWNAILVSRGERPLLNRGVLAEFHRQRSDALSLLRALIVTLLRRKPAGQCYTNFDKNLLAIVPPDSWQSDLWEVSFNQALGLTLPLFQRLDASPAELEAIQNAVTRDDLRARLRQVDVNVAFDPAEAARINRRSLNHALEKLQQIALAWALGTHGTDPLIWESRVDEFTKALSVATDECFYLTILTETDMFALLRTLPQDSTSAEFWSAFLRANSFPELIAALDLSEKALGDAGAKLLSFKEDVRRRNRLIEVAGVEFDSSEDNLAGLFDHIVRALPDERLKDIEFSSLDKPNTLTPLTRPARTGRNSDAPRAPMKIKHLSKGMEQVLGLAGEIHAFRVLRDRYHATQTSWISENGRRVFPENVSDDGRGCDFEIVHENRTYFIEVKATDGDDTSFLIGSSELRLAEEVALRKSKHRRNRFMILHVTRVLSDHPLFTLLPNPCDPRYASFFIKDDANVRIRYRM